MNKLGVVITDGVGYRNFILSDFINESKNTFDEVIIFSYLPTAVYKHLNLNCTIVELEIVPEKFITWFFRKAKELTHLKLHASNNFGIQDNLRMNYSNSKTPRGYATRLLFKWIQKIYSEKWILRLNRWQQLTFRYNNITKVYGKLLEHHKLNLLLFTHQRPPYIAPLIYAAEKQLLKTAAFIFSWDNLASKSRMAGNFDYYLVWSQLMKKELKQFYPLILDHQIKVVGTPQFEPYILERYMTSKAFFLKRFELEESNKTVLFSCGDISTSPNDPVYIEHIAHAIENNHLNEKVNFLVRTSPAEEPKRFELLAKKYSFIRWNYPDWKLTRATHQEMWSQRVPSTHDIIDLKALLQYSDIGINMLSTMSLDVMLFEKPVINTVFGNAVNGLGNDRRFLNYAHIKHMVNSCSVAVVKTEQELIDAINVCLENPSYKIKEQEEFLKLQIGKPLEGTSKRITQTLLSWCL